MKRTLCLLLCLIFMLPATAHAALPEISAPSAILMEKETGAILGEKNADTPHEPASVTKIMTLLLTMEAIDSGALKISDTVTVSAYAQSMGGSNVFLAEGEEITVDDLLKAVCVASGNDAAVALAETVSGTTELFVQRMNNRARELGMKNTHFVNCTGLPAEGHLTTARDIALMSRELILRHPDLRRYTTIWMDSLRGGKFQLSNTNKLIRFYPGATGLKTGSTSSAKFCLSATAERDGMELIAVVLKAPTSKDRFADAKALLNYGFAAWSLQPIRPEQPLPAIPVRLGTAPSVAVTLPKKSQSVLLPKSSAKISQKIVLPDFLDAPVEKGEKLGTLTVTQKDRKIKEIPLLAAQGVEKLHWSDQFLRMLAASLLRSPGDFS